MPSPSASTSRTIVPESVAKTAPPGPRASERTPPRPSAKRLTLNPLWTYSAWPAIRIVSAPAGRHLLIAPGSTRQPSSASAISRCRGAVRVTSTGIATPGHRGRSHTCHAASAACCRPCRLLPPLFRVHPDHGTLPRGHLLTARQRFLRRSLHLGRHRSLHLAQLLRRASLFLQVLLVQADGVALAPGLEHLGGGRLPRPPPGARGGPAPAGRLRDKHGRPLTIAAARRPQPGGGVGGQDVVAR